MPDNHVLELQTRSVSVLTLEHQNGAHQLRDAVVYRKEEKNNNNNKKRKQFETQVHWPSDEQDKHDFCL
jgi:hypothetical protein